MDGRRHQVFLPRLAAVSVLFVAVLGTAVSACRTDRAESSNDTLSPISTVTAPPESSTSTSTSTTVPPTTTTTIVVTGATVMVANASNVNGAAGRLSGELAALSFTMGEPTNGWGPWNELDTSAVYVAPGGEAVGASVAALMGLEPLRMPTPVWISGGSERLSGATVLVVLGKDRASVLLADMA